MSSHTIAVATLLGTVALAGQVCAIDVAHRHYARRPVDETILVERSAKEPHALRTFESFAEPDVRREGHPTPAVSNAGATWSGNGKRIAFDHDAAVESLRLELELLGVCRVQGATRGESTAEVAFMGTGRVLFVKLGARYHDTAVGACVARRLSRAETSVFDGDPQVIRVRFSL